jgi:hypothetical protein
VAWGPTNTLCMQPCSAHCVAAMHGPGPTVECVIVLSELRTSAIRPRTAALGLVRGLACYASFDCLLTSVRTTRMIDSGSANLDALAIRLGVGPCRLTFLHELFACMATAGTIGNMTDARSPHGIASDAAQSMWLKRLDAARAEDGVATFHEAHDGAALPAHCDVCVIGCGLTGAALAHYFSRPWLREDAVGRTDGVLGKQPSVVVLEARTVAGGATGRNGNVREPVAPVKPPHSLACSLARSLAFNPTPNQPPTPTCPPAHLPPPPPPSPPPSPPPPPPHTHAHTHTHTHTHTHPLALSPTTPLNPSTVSTHPTTGHSLARTHARARQVGSCGPTHPTRLRLGVLLSCASLSRATPCPAA